MAAKKKKSETAPTRAGALPLYWREAARPLVSLIFVAPMLLAYECGLLWLGPRAMRNGVDVWMRAWLDLAGFSQYFLLPAATCGILLAWHHVNRDRWRVRATVLYGMLLETVLLGIGLVFLGRVHSQLAESLSISDMTLAFTNSDSIGTLVAFLGAGIYEELLFRLMLIPAVAWGLRAAGAPRKLSWFAALVLSSLLFAAAHYQLDLALGPWRLRTAYGDAFQWRTFLFRGAAGMLFGVVFLFRGFGIAAASHALYDVLVSLE